MNRFLSLILVVACLFSFASCSQDTPLQVQGVDKGTPNQYNVVYKRPEGFFTPAPEKLLLDWDIKSVRNPYDNIADAQQGDYSMPIYRFDTYAEFSHLRDIIGQDNVPVINPVVDDSNYIVIYNDYRSGTFEKYTLLLGWFTLETCHTVDCYDIPDNYKIEGDNLILYVPKKDCECSESDIHSISGMIWVSVPKEELELINNISFVLQNCFSVEQ